MPLQRGGYTHIYNNLFSNLVTSGANIRMQGYSLIESNYFENSKNPVTSRDSSQIGYWELRNNNILSPADFSKYGITWVASDSKPTGSSLESFSHQLEHDAQMESDTRVPAVDSLVGQKG